MATIREWYEQERTKLTDCYHMALEGLDARLAIRQEKCSHQYEYVEELFYAIGNTAPGYLCKWCGDRRSDDPNAKPEKDESFFRSMLGLSRSKA